MQTDPVGYKDGLNWYDYVHNDPVNKTDPSGDFAGVDDAAEAIALAGVGVVYVGAVVLHDENTQHAIVSGVQAAGDFLGGLIHHNDQAKPPSQADKPGITVTVHSIDSAQRAAHRSIWPA